MSPVLALGIKMLVVAVVVVVATMIAERTRPSVAALVATLPLSVGATFVILALEHDAAYVSAAALKSVAGATATTLFIAAYARAAGAGWPLPASIGAAYAVWLPAALGVYLVNWQPLTAVAFSALATLLALVITAPQRAVESTQRGRRHWYDPLLRAAAVAVLVGLLAGLSDAFGPSGVGTLANFPIIMTSVGIIVQRRLGAEAVGSLMAHAIPGMAGVCLGLLALHATVESWGKPVALLTGLAICVAWNLALFRAGKKADANVNRRAPDA